MVTYFMKVGSKLLFSFGTVAWVYDKNEYFMNAQVMSCHSCVIRAFEII